MIVHGGQPMPAVLDRFDADDGPGLPVRDRALVRAMVRTTVRRWGDLSWMLDQLLARPLPKKAAAARLHLMLAAAQIVFMRQAHHAAVDCAVTILKSDGATGGFAGLANAVLRRLGRERDALIAALPVEANTPDWLWRRWVAHYGADAAAKMAAVHREEPPLDIMLAPGAAGPEGAVPLPTGGARLASANVPDLEGYSAGGWWVQDFAAQLPVTMLGPLQGKTAIDLCAAPGGKTMQLAAAGADVVALELEGARLARLGENLARTQLSERVHMVEGDALAAEGQYDAVLLDAPCSATGTLRRQPDVALARRPDDFARNGALQRRIIERAAGLLKPGGRLVYATCSLEPEEGEAHLAFIAEHLAQLTLLPVEGVAAPFAAPGGGMRTLPFALAGDQAGMDGFFAAAFQAGTA